MAYIPNISNYKPFYIQTASDNSAIDTLTWGMVAKSNPYLALPKPKTPYKNEWKDDNGDDEYTTQMFYEADEFTVSFYMKAFDTVSSGVVTKPAVAVLREQLDAFFNKVKNGSFKVYDSYTGLGRKDVRYAGFKEDSFKARGNWARIIFSVTFKMNDPITRVIYSSGVLTEVS